MKINIGTPIIILAGLYLVIFNIFHKQITINLFIGIAFIIMGIIKFYADKKKTEGLEE